MKSEDELSETENEKPEKHKVLTFFLIGFPTILVIALGMLVPTAWWAQVLLAFYQFVLLKQFLDKYYEVF